MGPTVTTELLDVRPLRKPDKHPTIFGVYDGLDVGESFVLLNNHDPVHLREEFEIEYAGGFGWEYLERGPQEWRIQVTKLASSALPRVLCNTARATEQDTTPAGAAWKLQMRHRDLDSTSSTCLPRPSSRCTPGPRSTFLSMSSTEQASSPPSSTPAPSRPVT
jgi:uncharacterized protein (DUF2249 family)